MTRLWLAMIACILGSVLHSTRGFARGFISKELVSGQRVRLNAGASETTKQPWVDTRPEPKTARDRVSFKNKVPFTEDVYETMKKAIELLSKRARTDPPPEVLTVEEAKWFKSAIEVIISDANKYGPPPRPARKPADSEKST